MGQGLDMEKSIFLITNSKNSEFGTGFVFDSDEEGSYILTSAHVVQKQKDDILIDDKKHN